MNLFPVRLDLKPCIDAWGSVATFKISAPDGSMHFCGVDVAPSAAGAIQTEDVYTKGASPGPLHSAALASVTNGGVPIAHSDYLGDNDGPGVLAFEAVAAPSFLYYLNPTPNDRNLEWDMKNNLCLKPGRVGQQQP